MAAKQEVEVPAGTLKPAQAKLLNTSLELEELWAEKERDRGLCVEREERESRELLAQLELGRVKATRGGAPFEPRFDVRSALSLMPMISEEEVDTFFEAFEVVARECDLPEAQWSLRVQSMLKGKAKVAFAALDPRQGLEYEALKKAVLTANGQNQVKFESKPINIHSH